MSAPTKQYGLIRLPKKDKNAKIAAPRASIFDSDSDEDAKAAVNREINLASKKNKVKRQTQIEIDKALADDPTVYAYDEVYDDMKEKEKEEAVVKLNQSKTVERKSRYIDGLKKAADKRQKEYERRTEKQVQKEREAEGDIFADKEKFVTSAYKKKMAEMEKLEAEELRKEQLESMMDVTKQADMSSFYRGLYKQTLGADVKTERKEANENQQQTSSSQGKQSESADVEVKEGSPVTDGANQAMKRECSASRDHGGLSPQSKHRDRDRESHQSASAERDKRHRSSRDEKHSHSQSKRQSRSLSRSRSRSKERRSRGHGDNKESTSDKNEAKDKSAKEATAEERFKKRNDKKAVQSARERYLARKAASKSAS